MRQLGRIRSQDELIRSVSTAWQMLVNVPGRVQGGLMGGGDEELAMEVFG